MHKANSKMV